MMRKFFRSLLTFSGLAAGGWLAWRYLSKRTSQPCPYWLSGVLETPLTEAIAGAKKLLDLLDARPGMAFLDVGSGPGRVSIPAAERVGPAGQVTALDIQPEMLAFLRERAAARGLTNLHLVEGGAGGGLLGAGQFDRAVLVTVLGETPDRQAVIDEIYRALKPGGRLAVAEYLPDPHFQRQAVVRHLANEAGFREVALTGRPWAYIMILEK